MPCPVCNLPKGEADHRMCLLTLFKTNAIKSVKDWEALCKPKTIIKGEIWVMLPKGPKQPSLKGTP